MAQSLEYYISQTAKNYEPSKKAIENQISNIDPQLTATNEQINRQYAVQQSQLNENRNAAATAASLQAAGSGGSFGGQANLANRKYYKNTFVPAQTQLNTNQTNDLSSARSTANSNRLSLQQQLANLISQYSAEGTKRYDAALEADRQEKLARDQLAEQQRQFNEQMALERERLAANERVARATAAAASTNWQQYLPQISSSNNSNQGVKTWDFGNGYSLQESNGVATYYKNNTPITAGRFLEGTGANGARWDLWNDVWNNGVSTTGVGSDTVAAFNRVSPSSSKYNYLEARKWHYTH